MLYVIGRDYNIEPYKQKHWMCVCDCQLKERVPKQRSIREDKLLEGRTLSCGCRKLLQKTRGIQNTNTFQLETYEYGVGYTNNGEEFLFDKEDYEKIINVSRSWHFNDGGYLEARDMRKNAMRYKNGRRKMVYLKDIVMNKNNGEKVTYKTQNKNDNRKNNLIKQ